MITINYSPLPGLERTGVLAPMVPVTYINGVYEFDTVALVDSGAEKALISTVVADALGIDWGRLPKHTGLTTSGSFIFHTYENLKIKIYDNEFVSNINIVEGVNAFKCILGRQDIFHYAKIIFEGYKKQFHIEFRKLN